MSSTFLSLEINEKINQKEIISRKFFEDVLRETIVLFKKKDNKYFIASNILLNVLFFNMQSYEKLIDKYELELTTLKSKEISSNEEWLDLDILENKKNNEIIRKEDNKEKIILPINQKGNQNRNLKLEKEMMEIEKKKKDMEIRKNSIVDASKGRVMNKKIDPIEIKIKSNINNPIIIEKKKIEDNEYKIKNNNERKQKQNISKKQINEKDNLVQLKNNSKQIELRNTNNTNTNIKKQNNKKKTNKKENEKKHKR